MHSYSYISYIYIWYIHISMYYLIMGVRRSKVYARRPLCATIAAWALRRRLRPCPLWPLARCTWHVYACSAGSIIAKFSKESEIVWLFWSKWRPISSRSPAFGLCISDTWWDTSWTPGESPVGFGKWDFSPEFKKCGRSMQVPKFCDSYHVMIFNDISCISCQPFRVNWAQDPRRLFGRPGGGHPPPAQLQALAEMNQTPPAGDDW